ncbi:MULTISPECIES: DUF7739 domain-containing protein [Streptomyces]|uniref:DUF7739 domain-containing protein n=1 Tax=Streptomyces TaxID=1883 RepID=UPI0036AD6C1A
MSRIHDPEAHVIVSHGADFFGQDRHPLKVLAALAPYVAYALPWQEWEEHGRPLRDTLAHPGTRTFTAPEAAQLADQLLKVSRSRGLKAKLSAVARLLADAAARAAADGEAWEWRLEAA